MVLGGSGAGSSGCFWRARRPGGERRVGVSRRSRALVTCRSRHPSADLFGYRDRRPACRRLRRPYCGCGHPGQLNRGRFGPRRRVSRGPVLVGGCLPLLWGGSMRSTSLSLGRNKRSGTGWERPHTFSSMDLPSVDCFG